MSTARPGVALTTLWQRMSPERMQPYVDAVGGDHASALRLYEWNTAISGALFESLGSLEVLLRNALHQQLAAHHAASDLSGAWYDDPANVLSDRARTDIAQARQRVAGHKHPVVAGRLVAELSFGFWRYLLAKQYEHTLWTPALSRTFPLLKPRRRDAVHDRLSRLNVLRNRIAHHEPIHGRVLVADYNDLLFVAGAICADTSRWIERTSRVKTTMMLRP